MKKHVAVDKSQHREVWKRLTCSSCWLHADFGDISFLAEHKGCDRQQHTNTPKMTEWLTKLISQHPMTATTTLSSSDSESEDDCMSSISEDDEIAAAVAALETAFSPEEQPEPSPENQPEPTATVDQPVSKGQPSKPESSSTTAPSTAPTAKPPSMPTTPPIPRPTSSKSSMPPTTAKAVIGVKRQNQRWTKDLEKKAISQKTAYTCLMDKHRALCLRYEDLEKQNKRMVSSDIALKKSTEELVEVKKDLRIQQNRTRELQTQCATLESRLAFSSETIRQQSEENRLLKEKLQQLESGGSFKTTQIHIPFMNGEIVDKILTFNSDDSDQECYEDPSQGVNCQHLTIKSAGKVTLKSWRVKKRAVRRMENECHKRPRHD